MDLNGVTLFPGDLNGSKTAVVTSVSKSHILENSLLWRKGTWGLLRSCWNTKRTCYLNKIWWGLLRDHLKPVQAPGGLTIKNFRDGSRERGALPSSYLPCTSLVTEGKRDEDDAKPQASALPFRNVKVGLQMPGYMPIPVSYCKMYFESAEAGRQGIVITGFSLACQYGKRHHFVIVRWLQG